MTDKLICTIWVCCDCMFTHANGETGANPDREPWNLLEREPEGTSVTMGLLHEEHECSKKDDPDCQDECECETQEFSWSRCEGCGSPLGGSRHAFALWAKDPVA